ncbi:MAG: D-sedoheptulose 7-phosphate isomerase [Actinobacteria bacterium]|nr:D-sedoheptulose 7-phosphate isomerase [Actinomycetota bacterium]
MQAREAMLRQTVMEEFQESGRLKQWLADNMADRILEVAWLALDAYRKGGKLIFCGNGGSAADAQHLAAELVGRLRTNRRALPAIALTTDTSILTAVGNDLGFDNIFARQVEALAGPNDVLIAISTSGRSENVNLAVLAAKACGAKTVALSAGSGARLAELADISLLVPSSDTQRVQECHISMGHVICGLLERELLNG